MRIWWSPPNGNVGIGNANPSTTLDVTGATRLVNPSGRSLMLEKDEGDSWITFQDPSSWWYSMGIDQSDTGKFKLNCGGNVGDANHFTMTAVGNFGFGTASPAGIMHLYVPSKARLLVEGNSTNQSILEMFGKGTGNTELSTAGNTGWTITVRGDQFSTEYLRNDLGISYWNGSAWRHDLAIDSLTGNVGLGTRQPASDAKLHVSGNIRLTGAVNPPDYVFETNYNLRPIEEVDDFVKENKHLPGIPPAKQIQEEGILVSDMFAKHLEKIEELTLYMIQLKKENDELKKRLTALEARN
jgi:hypothetical protein